MSLAKVDTKWAYAIEQRSGGGVEGSKAHKVGRGVHPAIQGRWSRNTCLDNATRSPPDPASPLRYRRDGYGMPVDSESEGSEVVLTQRSPGHPISPWPILRLLRGCMCESIFPHHPLLSISSFHRDSSSQLRSSESAPQFQPSQLLSSMLLSCSPG